VVLGGGFSSRTSEGHPTGSPFDRTTYNVKMAVGKKNPAAVAQGRKGGGKKGGPDRAAKLTPEQRRETAYKVVQPRWAKAKGGNNRATPATAAPDTSDHALLALLKRLKATNEPNEIRQLSDRIERVVFHKQYKNV